MVCDKTKEVQDGGEEQPTVLQSFSNVRLISPLHTDSCVGTLNITHGTLCWESTIMSESESPLKWRAVFTDINLHALSTDESSGYPPSIYTQIGDNFEEVRMIPEKQRLQALYDALCEGVSRNGDSSSEDLQPSLSKEASENSQ